jgi:phosphomannomutase
VTASITFGTDGWRALIAEDYTFDNVRLCAQAVSDWVRAQGKADQGIVIAYDTRFGSDRFAEAVAEVAAANKVPVALCEKPCPTPVASYSVVDRKAAGGVVITASHNPGAYNGFKVKPDFGGSAPPEVTLGLEARIRDLQREGVPIRRMDLSDAERSGTVVRFDPFPRYAAQVAKLLDLERPRQAGLKIVVDSMHGAGSGCLRDLLQGGSTQVIEIRSDVNPSFPGMHNPEPIEHNLVPLREAVLREHADLGLATDGDADRIGVMDERGVFVNQLQTYALLFLYLLEVRGQRGPAVRSLTSTMMADRLGARYGVPVYETAVGFKYVGPKMIETNAILGGEESGGFGFGGHIPERDAPVAGLFLIDLMVALGKPMSQVLDHLTEEAGASFYDRWDVTFAETERKAILGRVSGAAPDKLCGRTVVSVNEIDGKKFVLDDGSWLLIRFSGTEPLLRIYTETSSADQVQRILAAGRELAGV